MAVLGGRYFIQGVSDGTAYGNLDPRSNADIFIEDPITPFNDEPKHVECNYTKLTSESGGNSTFEITGRHFYDHKTGVDGEYISVVARVVGIVDDGSVGLKDVSSAAMHSMEIFQDHDPDSLEDRRFVADDATSCLTDLWVNRLPLGPGTCPGGEPAMAHIVQIGGVYECPSFTSDDADAAKLDLTDGAWYCEVAEPIGCPPGGGGGGGGLPPNPQ